MLLPVWPRLGGGALFGPLGQWLPSFVHPFAFSLLTRRGTRTGTEASATVPVPLGAP